MACFEGVYKHILEGQTLGLIIQDDFKYNDQIHNVVTKS